MKYVPLMTFPNRIIAEITATMLRGSGVDVLIRSDDAGGVDPALALIHGVKLLVPAGQLSLAQDLLAQALDT